MQFDANRHGQIYKLDDGRIMVAWERQLNHSINEVWRTLTDAKALSHWFIGLRVDTRQGGAFSINFDGDCDGPDHVTGDVEIYDPPNELKLGTMHYQLKSNDDGCLLKFSDILLFDKKHTRQAIAISVLGGWHSYLDKLEAWLEGNYTGEDMPEPPYGDISVPGWEHL